MSRPFGEPLQYKVLNPDSTRARVLSNFFMTFWHSQGKLEADSRFAKLCAYRTRTTWDEADQALLDQLGPLTATDMIELRLPGGHGATARNVRKEFDQRWNEVRQLYADPNFTKGIEKVGVSTIAKELGRRVLLRDWYSQRPGGMRHFSTCGDPHESMYGTFVMGGRDTGSTEFNWIYERTKEQHDGQDPKLLSTVAKLWEGNHPGKTFLENPVHIAP